MPRNWQGSVALLLPLALCACLGGRFESIQPGASRQDIERLAGAPHAEERTDRTESLIYLSQLEPGTWLTDYTLRLEDGRLISASHGPIFHPGERGQSAVEVIGGLAVSFLSGVTPGGSAGPDPTSFPPYRFMPAEIVNGWILECRRTAGAAWCFAQDRPGAPWQSRVFTDRNARWHFGHFAIRVLYTRGRDGVVVGPFIATAPSPCTEQPAIYQVDDGPAERSSVGYRPSGAEAPRRIVQRVDTGSVLRVSRGIYARDCELEETRYPLTGFADIHRRLRERMGRAHPL